MTIFDNDYKNDELLTMTTTVMTIVDNDYKNDNNCWQWRQYYHCSSWMHFSSVYIWRNVMHRRKRRPEVRQFITRYHEQNTSVLWHIQFLSWMQLLFLSCIWIMAERHEIWGHLYVYYSVQIGFVPDFHHVSFREISTSTFIIRDIYDSLTYKPRDW